MRKHVKSPFASLAALVVSTGLLGACASTATPEPAPITPLSRYALQVEPGLDRIALAVHEDGLSRSQHAALTDFVDRFASSGAAVVRIEMPAGEDPAAASQAYAVRAQLRAWGVSDQSLYLASYDAPDARAPILVGFETVRARLPNCAIEPRNMVGRASNQVSGGFGCAITANMAAQIANPRDILTPRTMTPPDSGRAAVVFDRYRKGEASSTPQEFLVNGAISNAVD